MAAKILVLEDDPQLREILERALTRYGYQPVTAGSLAEGDEKVSEGPYAALLCDMRLPDGDGLTFLKNHRDDFENAGTQIVVVSAEPQYGDLTAELGVEFFLTKPISLQMLKTLLSRLLGQHTQ